MSRPVAQRQNDVARGHHLVISALKHRLKAAEDKLIKMDNDLKDLERAYELQIESVLSEYEERKKQLEIEFKVGKDEALGEVGDKIRSV